MVVWDVKFYGLPPGKEDSPRYKIEDCTVSTFVCCQCNGWDNVDARIL